MPAVPPRRRPGAERRGGAARDRARRPPRRAHRPRRARTTWQLLDGFLDARRVAAPVKRLMAHVRSRAPMRAWWVVILVLLLPAGASAQVPRARREPPVEPIIPIGATAAGLDIGGLTLPQAAAKLQRRVRRPRSSRRSRCAPPATREALPGVDIALRVRRAQDRPAREHRGAGDAAAPDGRPLRRRAAARQLRPRGARRLHRAGRPRGRTSSPRNAHLRITAAPDVPAPRAHGLVDRRARAGRAARSAARRPARVADPARSSASACRRRSTPTTCATSTGRS